MEDASSASILKKGTDTLRSEVEVLPRNGGGYSWKHGWRVPDISAYAVRALHAKYVLTDNVTELRKLQDTRPGVVANVYQAKKEGRQPSEEEQQ